MLEVGESRVRQRLGEGTLYGVKAGRENRLPAFQFEGGKEVPGIAEVLARVDRSLHPVAVLNWFMESPTPICTSTKKKRDPSPRGTGCSSGGDPGSWRTWRKNFKGQGGQATGASVRRKAKTRPAGRGDAAGGHEALADLLQGRKVPVYLGPDETLRTRR